MMGCKETYEGWYERVPRALGFGYQLPQCGWRRVLALWGCVGVPFFQAFRDP